MLQKRHVAISRHGESLQGERLPQRTKTFKQDLGPTAGRRESTTCLHSKYHVDHSKIIRTSRLEEELLLSFCICGFARCSK